jgi:hypothetical protein
MNAKNLRTVAGVILMSALLALYIVFAAYQAALLVMSGEPFTLAFGLALFVAPIIGIWSLFRELKFGRDSQRMFAHYIAERLSNLEVAVTMLARGVPVGGDLDWLDDGTIAQAMRARRPA